MSLTLTTPIQYVPRVGPAMAKRLERLSITTVKDLLFTIPFRYNDFSQIIPIGHIRVGETITVKGEVQSITNVFTKTGKKIQQAKISDGTGILSVVWFNQPFLTRIIHKGDYVAFAGTINWFGNTIVMESPEYELIGSGPLLHTGRLVPIYSETNGVSSKWLRGRIHAVLPEILPTLADPLPDFIKQTYHLNSLHEALTAIHAPETLKEAEEGKNRLAFDELLTIQLQSYFLKRTWETTQHANPISLDNETLTPFLSSLPFTLTDDQTKALTAIIKDLQKSIPMNRLLEGDVGSGKTVVAAAAMYALFKNGFGSVMMAPTQILAEQHFQTIQKLLQPFDIPVELITGNKKQETMSPLRLSEVSKRQKAEDRGHKKEKIKLQTMNHACPERLPCKGSVRELPTIFIGTHALLQNAVTFNNIGLIVIDEQQRFGVGQRALLKTKSTIHMKTPHLLTMTATPIPRTIALTLYGNLDLSVITMMPVGRQPVKTWVIPQQKRSGAYQWIREQLTGKNRRAFIVCPFIEESESMTSVKAAVKEFDVLKNEIFPDIPIALLHGRMKSKEKTDILTAFRDGKTQILVTTPVVEVGIDIPEATVMVIEGSERFGLSGLHQLRGRVGRGKEQSYCLLFSNSQQEQTLQRLKAMETIQSGPQLSEIDLKIRGEGDIFGLKQHGLPSLTISSLSDLTLVEKTKETLSSITKQDPELTSFPLLREMAQKSTIEDISQD